MNAHPIPNSYWAAEGRLLIGPLPTGEDREKQKEKIRALLDAGIRCIIDLTTPADAPSLRVPWSRLAQKAGTKIAWISAPIGNGEAPNIESLETILDLIDGSIKRGRPVYLHCLGGLGRSASVGACWMIRHGLADPGEGVIQKIAELRRGQPHGDAPSPETAPQRRLVANWKRGR